MNPIKCHRKYPITTNFLDTMLEHSIDIKEGESKLDAYRRGLKELDEIAAELRKEANPHQESTGMKIQFHTYEPGAGIPENSQSIPIISQEKEPGDRRIGVLVADIYSCEDLKTLETYKFLAKAKPELQAAYDQQHEKLSK